MDLPGFIVSNQMEYFISIQMVKTGPGIHPASASKRPLSKRQKIGFQDQLALNAGQKYYRMLQRKHCAILSTFIKLPTVIKLFVLSILSVAVLQRFYYIK